MSREAPKLFIFKIRTIGRILEMATMILLGIGLLLLSYRTWWLFAPVIAALISGLLAYGCALRSMPKKSKRSKIEKPFDINDRYLIDKKSLEEMTVDGVPWDVIAVLAKLINCPLSSPPAKKPTVMTEVELIQLVSPGCDLERINEFREKILKHTRIEHTIDPSDSSKTLPSDLAPAASASTLESSTAVRAP